MGDFSLMDNHVRQVVPVIHDLIPAGRPEILVCLFVVIGWIVTVPTIVCGLGFCRDVLGANAAAFAVVAATSALGWTPWLAAVPFAGFLARGLWAVQQPRPVPNMKRFGFTEIGVELLGGALIAAGYLLLVGL